MRHNEGQGKVQHAPDIVRASTTEPISALRSTIGSLWSAGCAWPRDRLNPDAASRSVVDFDPRLVADAAECLSLGLQTRRARPKSFLRRPPRARRRPSEPSCYSSPGGVKRHCAHLEQHAVHVISPRLLHILHANLGPYVRQPPPATRGARHSEEVWGQSKMWPQIVVLTKACFAGQKTADSPRDIVSLPDIKKGAERQTNRHYFPVSRPLKRLCHQKMPRGGGCGDAAAVRKLQPPVPHRPTLRRTSVRPLVRCWRGVRRPDVRDLRWRRVRGRRLTDRCSVAAAAA